MTVYGMVRSIYIKAWEYKFIEFTDGVLTEESKKLDDASQIAITAVIEYCYNKCPMEEYDHQNSAHRIDVMTVRDMAIKINDLMKRKK